MTHFELKKEWQARISDFKSSGQSGAAWCAANQINLHQFYYWKKRLDFDDQPKSQSTNWLSFEISNRSKKPSEHILIRIGEVAIEIKQGYDPELLLNVIQTLRASC